MTCCIGKARVYFREPINYWLTYQLPDGSLGSVTAPEPLTTECERLPFQTFGDVYIFKINYKFKTSQGCENRIRTGEAIAPVSYSCPITTFSLGRWYYPTITSQGVSYIVGYNYWGYFGDPCDNPYDFRGSTCTFEKKDGEDPIVYEFKVIGAETGTEYANIGGLEECPEVISNICLMGEERYIDVEMGSGIPLLPNFVPDCLIAVTGWPLPENAVQIQKIRVNPTPTNPLKPKLPQPVLTLQGLPGCPAEYRIECCPNGSCEPEEQCPPDTDCSLECDGLVCCYKNGRVIRSFRR